MLLFAFLILYAIVCLSYIVKLCIEFVNLLFCILLLDFVCFILIFFILGVTKGFKK